MERRGREWALAVLVAPDAWLKGHTEEAVEYHLDVSLEAIVQWCRERSPLHRFRADVLEQACRELTRGAPAADLQEWHRQIDRVLMANYALQLAPQKLTRVEAAGRARPGRFIACREDTLGPVPGVGPAWLMLKTASANHRGRANVEVYRAPTAFVEFVKRSAVDGGFQIRHSDAGTLMVDNSAPGAETWTTGPFEAQVEQVHAIARAADELRTWWQQHVTGIDWES